MFDMYMEFRKGILFVRLYGEITSNTVFKIKKEVSFLIEENGIDNVVFNLKNVFSIDNMGINTLYKIYEKIEKHNGSFLICTSDFRAVNFMIEKSHLNKYITILPSELAAFSLVKI